MEESYAVMIGEDGEGEIKFRVYINKNTFTLNVDSGLLQYDSVFDYYAEEEDIYDRLITDFENHCGRLFHAKIMNIETFMSYRDTLIEIASEVSELDYNEMRDEKFKTSLKKH